MKILITGGAGFAGSHLAIYLKTTYPQYEIFCLDNLKRRGSELNIPRLTSHQIHFIHGDIRNKEDFDLCPRDTNLIIEASAEPSVLAGLNNAPDYLINTNLGGTINCLNFAARTKADFIFLSTSRVYPIEAVNAISYGETDTRFIISEKQERAGVSPRGIREDFSIEGFRSLYGATKLCSELMIWEYNKFFDLRCLINRCGVLTGPWQMGKVDQGFIILWVARHYWKQELGYFGYGGKGKQVRDILHINDLCRLIDYQMHHMAELNGQLFNVGGGQDVSVSLKELTAVCQAVTGNKVFIKEVKEDRQADIRIYITDNSRVSASTGWAPGSGLEQIVQDAFRWIQDNEALLKPILAG